MKTAAKVFLIIGLVFSSILLLISFILVFYLPFSIILIIWDIISILITCGSLNYLNKATCKSDLITIAILTLIFCNLIAGILMLCCQDSDFEENIDENKEDDEENEDNYYNDEEEEYIKPIKAKKKVVTNIAADLKVLFELKEQGILSEEEFKEKKEKLLKDL